MFFSRTRVCDTSAHSFQRHAAAASVPSRQSNKVKDMLPPKSASLRLRKTKDKIQIKSRCYERREQPFFSIYHTLCLPHHCSLPRPRYPLLHLLSPCYLYRQFPEPNRQLANSCNSSSVESGALAFTSTST